MKKPYQRGWDKMRLGAVWNFWDGEETLAESVESIRDHVDFIAIVFQRKSNFGELRTDADSAMIAALFKKLKFDEILNYEPKAKGSAGEIQKRNQGIDLCRAFACTHFLTIDADEVYDGKQIEQVKADIQEYNYATTCAPIATHYKHRGCVLNPSEDYFVPLIYRLDERRFGRAEVFPVVADPTRKLTTGNTHRRRIYFNDEVTMQHLSFVRSDAESFARKLRNSSASVNWPGRINELVEQWERYEPGQDVILPYRGTADFKIHKTSLNA